MRTLCTILTLVVALAVAGNLCAAEKEAKEIKEAKKAHKAQKAEWKVPDWLAGLKLTDEQKEKIKAIDQEFAPKWKEINKKAKDILTEEQKKAQDEIQKRIKSEGKKGKEAKELIETARKLSEEQKTKMAAVTKEREALMNEFREKVKTVLTDEQKEQLKKAGQLRGKRGAKKAKDA